MRYLMHVSAFSKSLKSFVADPTFAFFSAAAIACALTSLSVAGVITIKVAVALLVLAWIFTNVATLVLDDTRPINGRHRIILASLSAIVLFGIGLIEYRYRPPPPSSALANELPASSDTECKGPVGISMIGNVFDIDFYGGNISSQKGCAISFRPGQNSVAPHDIHFNGTNISSGYEPQFPPNKAALVPWTIGAPPVPYPTPAEPARP